MSVAARRDFERVLLSLVIAVLVHIVIFLLFPVLINLSKRELPRYSGPIYVNIEEVPRVSKITAEEKKESTQVKKVATSSQTVTNRQSIKPLTENRVITTGQSSKEAVVSNVPTKTPAPVQSNQIKPVTSATSETAIGKTATSETAIGSLNRTGLQAPGETKNNSVVSAEESSPLYIEKRETNIPLALNKKEEKGGENVSELPHPNKLALGEGTYSNLDKLLKTTENQSAGTENAAETKKSQVVSGTGLSGTELSGKGNESSAIGSFSGGSSSVEERNSNIQIQWEKPSLSREAVYTPDPVIPNWVSRQGLQLEVTVSFTLLPEGIISAIKLLRSSGFSDVDSAVIEAIRRWRFQPVAGAKSVLGRITYVIKPKR